MSALAADKMQGFPSRGG